MVFLRHGYGSRIRITDTFWERLSPHLPDHTPKAHPLGCHRRRVPDRQVLDSGRRPGPGAGLGVVHLRLPHAQQASQFDLRQPEPFPHGPQQAGRRVFIQCTQELWFRKRRRPSAAPPQVYAQPGAG